MPATPIAERGYANPDFLADTGWLAAHLDDADLRLIDTRSAQLYEAGHIPGAVNLAAHGSVPRAANGDIGTPEEFEALARRLGVSPDSTVVVYDAPGAQMGSVAWAFSYFGHGGVRVLDGGYEKWTAENRPTSTTRGSYPPGGFEAHLVEGIFCSLDHAKSAHGKPGTVFWDVRRPGEYDGRTSRCMWPGTRRLTLVFHLAQLNTSTLCLRRPASVWRANSGSSGFKSL